MMYYLVRPIARYVLSWYYRRIDITGLEHLPASGPVIIAANHPTAFIEPCILACYQGRSLWFLARGNLFKNSLASWALNRLHILPVYRLDDAGYGKLKENFSTFSACRDTLTEGKAIMILAEGRCIHEKRLRALMKGTGRVALSSLADNAALADIPIIPVGVNFTHADRIRSSVTIRFGKPLSTKNYLASYQENENTGVLQLTRALAKAIDPLVVQIPEIELDGVGETLLAVDRGEHGSSLQYGFGQEGRELDRALQLAGKLKQADTSLLERYGNRLQKAGLREAAVSGGWRSYLELGVLDWLKFFLAGILLLWHLPLLLIGEYIGGTSTRAIEFYSPVRFATVAIGMAVYPLFWLIGLHPYLIVYSLIAIVSVNWSWKHFEAGQRWFHARAAWRQTPGERQILQDLRAEVILEKDRLLKLPR